jgi:hypothetical protein
MITEADVAALGLYPHLPRHLEEFPPELHEHCGRGIGVWQYPNQFAKYLNAMMAENEDIRTYVEIGVAAGGTFMATVDILKPSRRSVAIDIAPIGKSLDDAYRATPYDGQLEAFIAADPEKRSYFRGTAREFAESDHETIDLLLIDGDHSYEGVKADFEALGSRSRIAVFHDIASDACPGVVRFWKEIVDLYGPERTETFVDQYASVVKGSFLGIGVLR